MKTRESGMATVEFAIAGAAVLTVLFSCIEVGRMLFVWNTIGEATRAAARLATISSYSATPTTIKNTVVNYPGLYGLTAANVSVSYLDEAYVPTTDPTLIKFVSVGMVPYPHKLLIPFVETTVMVPAFQTTLPAESLGFLPP